MKLGPGLAKVLVVVVTGPDLVEVLVMKLVLSGVLLDIWFPG